MGAETSELKLALAIIEIASLSMEEATMEDRLDRIHRTAVDALGEAIETVKKLLPRAPHRIESEDGVKIHPKCSLLIDGMDQEGFIVGAFGVEYAAPGFIPGVVNLGLGRGPHVPIVQVFVESEAFVAIKEGIGCP